MKSFKIPEFYKSPVISRVKSFRKAQDPRKQNTLPTVLDFGEVTYYIARHFGFCYGVENAIEISFKALEENPGKRVFLLSQMIHNPVVNADLESRGVRFLHDTQGNELISMNELTSSDVVIIPAFGAPLAVLKKLEDKGVTVNSYNTTCPFVERVWKKSEQIGAQGHTIIIHGKYNHEETRSTFSRSEVHSKAVVVIKDMEEAKKLAQYVLGNLGQKEFEKDFAGKFSKGFLIERDFQKIGVINQTTMLATETAEIAAFLRRVMEKKFGPENIKNHFADTRDTLCYATNENQDATYGLLETDAHLAIVVGGYNSSNTSHLVELCEKKFKTYFISSAKNISANEIMSFDIHSSKERTFQNYLPSQRPLKIILTSGASCPDSLLDDVIYKINELVSVSRKIEEVLASLCVYSS